MKVVVTGGAGKLGRWVVRDLTSAQHAVTIFDKVRSAEAADRILTGDIENLSEVSEAFDGADAVIHLAGIPTHGVVADDVTFRINVMGTFNVHEAARRRGIRRVVSLSSEAVLGWAPGSWEREHVPAYLPIDENHPCAPQDCYGLSKQVMEEIARSFTAKCGMVTVLIRAPWLVSPRGTRATGQVGRPHAEPVCAVPLCRCPRPCPGMPARGGAAVAGHPYDLCGIRRIVRRRAVELAAAAVDAVDRRQGAGLAGRRAAVSIDKAKRLLGWEPQHSWRGLAT